MTNRSALRKSDLREVNQRLLLNIVRKNPGTSRADIARITGFTPSSVTFIVNRMIRDGLLEEAPCTGHSRVGRRPLTLNLRPESRVASAIEINASGARIVLSDLNGKILKKRTVAWAPGPDVFLARVRDALQSLSGHAPAGRHLGVGVSLPGTIDRSTGMVIAAENLGWFSVDAGRILSTGVQAPLYFENDAKLGALAETWFCAPGSQPLNNFIYLTLHPGLGTGVVIEGRLFHGSTGAASEFGHASLFPDGRRCVCGGVGCWEEYASQRAVERTYAERLGNGLHPVTHVEEIIRLAREGDPVALGVLRETAVYIGMGMANLNAAFDPEAIVVGDYLASGWDLMGDWVWEALSSRAPNRYLTRLRIVPSRHGRDATLKGALALVLSHFFTGSRPSNGNVPSAL
ncbi:MAG: ROK family transcriptional regulator [Acidobacteria bacterium]|nr:ROK family transcriptional regulator [Acidobacteriota bacterium]